MDRYGNKEIKRIIMAVLCVLAGMVLLMVSYLGYGYNRSNEMAAELALQVPSAESIWIEIRERDRTFFSEEEHAKEKELREKYGYYVWSARESREILLLLAAELLLSGVILSLFLYFLRKREKEEEEKTKDQIRKLERCMECFIEGDFDTDRLRNLEALELQGLGDKVQKLGNFIENMKERLEQEENSTKALITDISHQLKTPFAAFKLSYEMLQEDTLTKEEREEFYAQGLQELGNLEKLIQLLLNMSRLEGNMIRLKPQMRNLKETVLGAVNTVIMQAVDKNIEISADMKDCMTKHDFRWTQEAVINVLDNAVKYSMPGSRIEIHLNQLTSYVMLEISDQGIGISSKEKNKIFQRFYRGEQAKEMERDGAGVGLYLARQILEQQGGTICVKEQSCKTGSCFCMMLPLCH